MTAIHSAQRDQQALADTSELADTLLRPDADSLDQTGEYPDDHIARIGAIGLKGMAIDSAYGGIDLSWLAQARVFTALAEGCLASAFILTQHQGSTTLFMASPNEDLKQRWLPRLASGEAHTTNGFNFLNLPPERAPMRASPVAGGFRLDGVLPWVTAADHADVVAAGAVLDNDGTQIMVAIPLREAVTRLDGTVVIDPPMQLAALTASHTTTVQCHDYFVPEADVLLGPGPQLLKETQRGATAFVPTALTIGHARSSLSIVTRGAARKGGPALEMQAWLEREIAGLEHAVTEAITNGAFDRAPALRGRGNALAQRAAHFALIVGGGTGYRLGETAQRLYREAGFFQVWSVAGEIIPRTLDHLLGPLAE